DAPHPCAAPRIKYESFLQPPATSQRPEGSDFLPLTFASEDSDAIAWLADPEGVAQDVRRFSRGHGCPVEKSLHHRVAGFALSGKRFSLLPVLLTLIKRNEVAEGESL